MAEKTVSPAELVSLVVRSEQSENKIAGLGRKLIAAAYLDAAGNPTEGRKIRDIITIVDYQRSQNHQLYRDIKQLQLAIKFFYGTPLEQEKAEALRQARDQNARVLCLLYDAGYTDRQKLETAVQQQRSGPINPLAEELSGEAHSKQNSKLQDLLNKREQELLAVKGLIKRLQEEREKKITALKLQGESIRELKLRLEESRQHNLKIEEESKRQMANVEVLEGNLKGLLDQLSRFKQLLKNEASLSPVDSKVGAAAGLAPLEAKSSSEIDSSLLRKAGNVLKVDFVNVSKERIKHPLNCPVFSSAKIQFSQQAQGKYDALNQEQQWIINAVIKRFCENRGKGTHYRTSRIRKEKCHITSVPEIGYSIKWRVSENTLQIVDLEIDIAA